ncbi:putative membrane protein [Laceyella sediminis]|uniref:Membrane protein n=1 Tax=Laceyella sediminis TaxID=573074 RepID=A0ABX5ESD6_9BACL|nr:YhgE/Pip domain-containing protein [Laceyella sediminis]PRZ16651.1 putative membrane protein [Laceyella sediminis]
MKWLKEKLATGQIGFRDLQSLWSQKPMRLALMGILAIPLVYSLIYLKAFYDPYENMQYLPVAVVNEDRGVVKDGERIDIGDELRKKLSEDSKVKWEFVSRDQMMEGFREERYYIGIVIPKDLSQKAVSLDSPKPLKGQLEYYVDESTNYLSGKIGESLRRELEISLEENLTEAYAEEIFGSIAQSTRDLDKAAKGAAELRDGTRKALSASGQLAAALGKLEDGLSQITSGLQLASGKVDATKVKVAQAMPYLEAADRVLGRLEQVLNQPLGETGRHMADWVSRLRSSQSTLAQSGVQLDRSQAALDRLLARHPELAGDKDIEAIRSALGNAEGLQGQSHQKIGQLAIQAPGIKDKLDRLEQARQRVVSEGKVRELHAKVKQVQKDLNQINVLASGLNQLENGANKALSGTRQIHDGQNALRAGLKKIHAGQAELAKGLKEGVANAKEKLKGVELKENMLADPIVIKEKNFHAVPNYATGFAPYFISLSLWVGAMLLFTVVDLYRAIKRPGGEPLSLATGGLIGSAQAVILCGILLVALNLQPKLTGWMYLFTIIMAFTFIAINQMLVALFGNVGRFLAIIVLMLQLASSGGSYPVELLPEFFRALHPYLPMTYTIHGLRAILSNGNVQAVLHDTGILLGFMAGAYMVTQTFLLVVRPWMQSLSAKLKTRLAQSS